MPFAARYRASPEEAWQEFTLNTDDLTAALVAVQRRMFPHVTDAEWEQIDARAWRRLLESRARREQKERDDNERK